jgi:hypothetical protein
MSINEWWPDLRPETRDWLLADNGDAIPADIVDELTMAGRSGSGDRLADDEIDWVEAVANGEEPGE